MSPANINEKNMFRNYPDIVTASQLQEMLNIGRTYAYKLLKNQEIYNKKVGKEYKIPKIGVIEYVKRNE